MAMVLLAAGCAGPNAARQDPTPIALSYPYLTVEEAKRSGFRELAERVAGSYVRVVIREVDDGAGDERPGIVSSASGSLVDARGYVVTAAHIAKDRRLAATVITRDGVSRAARILRIDPRRELALLKLDPFAGLCAVRFADGRALRRGDFALAIGSPRLSGGVVSLGTIRAPRLAERLQYGRWGFENAIEISMEVRSGHSGGPVFNRLGEFIGMVAGYELGDTSRPRYVSPRIAYAVPAADVAAFLEDALPK